MKSRLLARKTTTPRFRLDLTEAQASDLLTAAYAAEVESRHGSFRPDAETQAHIRQAARALTGAGKFGIAFCGEVGNGKTTLMSAVCGLTAYLSGGGECFRMVKATDIAAAYGSRDGFRALCGQGLLAIDDLGCEPVEVVSYGNILTPTVELLMHRYDAQLFTMLTTNIEPGKIKDRYGERIADRFREMLHVIPFTNKTYRT